MGAIVPVPKTPLTTRLATMADLPFIDSLQKANCKALGYFPTKQFEGYIASGSVLIAEAMNVDGGVLNVEGSQQSTVNTQQSRPLGYVIGKDRYLKRDELGVIYQLCVVPGDQRKLIGAALVRAVFERSAYGCRLYCCWCAQDLEANYFWESLGFVPIAFRAGSSGKHRVHIFWEKRIQADDASTPYWYPFQTNAGAIREDRLVFPIPPGTHWKEVRAVVLPGGEDEGKQLSGPGSETPSAERPAPTTRRRAHGEAAGPAVLMSPVKSFELRGLSFAPAPPPTRTKPKRPSKEKQRNDPRHSAVARELRDRYLEQVNSGGLIAPAQAKYQLTRATPSADRLPGLAASPLPALPAPVAA